MKKRTNKPAVNLAAQNAHKARQLDQGLESYSPMFYIPSVDGVRDPVYKKAILEAGKKAILKLDRERLK